MSTSSLPAPWTKHYQPGVPAEIELPTESLVGLYERSVAEGGDAVALEFFGKETTYTSLGDQISRAAEGLRGLGVKAGDRVALILPNCPQHVVAFYAVLRLGAIVVEHNPLYTARELRHLFEDHGARVVIAWDVAVAKLREQPADITLDAIVAVNLLQAFPTVKRLALSLPVKKLRQTRDRLTQPARDTISWEKLLSSPPIDPGHPRPTVDDVAVVQYTSGTTGQPKGAILTHSNLFSNARQGEAWMHGAQYRRETFYAILPMFHAFGMTLFLTYGILKQARLVLFPQFDVDMVLDAAKKHPPTVYCAVPPIYEATAKRAKERGISLRTAKYCISGAMSLPNSTVELWESVSGGLLVEGYGMTEASPVCLGNPFAASRRTGTIGVPFPSTWMKVVDPEDPTREVAQGERGELLIHGPQVFHGYWHNEVETEKTLLPGRWLRTGDIVTVDEDGFTSIVDRVKELIITGGFNVAPSEVEAVLLTHPGVRDVAVVGLPNEEVGGERVIAAITPEPGTTLTHADLRAWCKERLTGYKVPRDFYLIDELPKSMLGKVLRKQVRDDLAALSPLPH
ncbi:long-chain fatty acid--CoA ligase [Tessaracoccus aquimaris]|uniref:Long-chain fatty acid--CoA ligase n=1 Tax=Tessaracoccus aquimaris TaxID=1332264 RepID=A0A1Q2CQ90_9ACTN|nr:long-chain-fatty-acid--CoA ligase [Tessaracoccus aquimaris]AQP48286.1 long-chain fatty acid--CoA ligase [Tessaracoccus aquimaris]